MSGVSSRLPQPVTTEPVSHYWVSPTPSLAYSLLRRRIPSPAPAPFASPHPEKSVTFPRHPCPGPTPVTPHARPTSAISLRNSSPPVRPGPSISLTPLQYTYIRAILAHVRDRPRSPGNPTPKLGSAPGICRGVPCRCPTAAKTWLVSPFAPCPTLPRGATVVLRNAHAGTTEWRRTAGAPSYELCGMVQKCADFSGTSLSGASSSPCPALSRKNGRMASVRVRLSKGGRISKTTK